MKYSLEMNGREYIATLELCKLFVEMIAKDNKRRAQKRELRAEIADLKKQLAKEQKMMFGEFSEEDSSEEESIAYPDVVEPPISFADVIEGGKKEEGVNAVKAKRGKEELTKLLDLWLLNFNKEGEPQPDRGAAMKDLASSAKGPSILEFVKLKEGLTLAVKESWPSDRPINFSLMRQVAENLAQVTSILFPPIAPHLEYPNPLEE